MTEVYTEKAFTVKDKLLAMNSAYVTDEAVDAAADKLEGFKFSVGEVEEDGDSATAEVTINTYDLSGEIMGSIMECMTEAYSTYMNNSDSSQIHEAFVKVFKSRLRDIDKRELEFTAELQLSKDDEGWKVSSIDDEESFVNSLLGGLPAAEQALLSAAGE